MSLNGLDDAKVKEAHDVAVAEPGGWFLLKYVSRDEIELLGQGNAGIVEIRNSIAQYEELSPLFGFLRYRRRNVLIRYVPEGCSRLVQARVAVHFNAISERFSPHDTIFPITTFKELKDSTLSAACRLHTASGSTSSSTSSLRRRRLMEIAEDAEEDKRQSIVMEERPLTATKETPLADLKAPLSSPMAQNLSPSITASSVSFRDLAPDTEPSALPLMTPELETRPGSPTRSFDGRRSSSQSQRPDLYSYSSSGSNNKPRVKLGPRPSLDITIRRPHTSSSSGYRPISTLPAGLKLFSRSSKKSKVISQSQHPSTPPSMTVSPPIESEEPLTPPGETLVRPHTSGGRPNTSSRTSVTSPLSPGYGAPKLPGVTPEKVRLMKALQMRKKKLAYISPTPAQPFEVFDVCRTSSITEHSMSPRTSKDLDTTQENCDAMPDEDLAAVIKRPVTSETLDSKATRTSSSSGLPIEHSVDYEFDQASLVPESTDVNVQKIRADGVELTTFEHVPIQALQENIDTAESGSAETTTFTENDQPSVSHDIIEPAKDDNTFEDANSVFESQDKRLPITDTITSNPESSSLAEEIFAKEAVDVGVPELDRISQSNSSLNATNVETRYSSSEFVAGKDECEAQAIDGSFSPVGYEANPKEHLKVNTETPVIPGHDWKIPRSKFSVHGTSVVSEGAKFEPVDNIPRSKFSAQNLKAHEIATSTHVPPPWPGLLVDGTPKSPMGSTYSYSSDTKRSCTEDEKDCSPGLITRKKRLGLVDPIRTDISHINRSSPNSESDFLNDDDLMDELQSATVQEAQPISVSRSPISPVFPKQGLGIQSVGNRFSRALSNPLKRDASNKLVSTTPLLPENSRSVSASAAYLNRINQKTTGPLVKKVNLGSSISQRIKALEKLSSTADVTLTPTTPAASTAAAFYSVRNPSTRGTSKSPSIAERANSLTANTPSPALSRESLPEPFNAREERSESLRSRRENFNATPSNQGARVQPESISVTARIIRDPSQLARLKHETGKDTLSFTPLNLQQSPLVIDHQKAIEAPQGPKDTIQERRLSSPTKDAKKEHRTSITIVRELIADKRNSFAEHRRSMTIEEPPVSEVLSPMRPPSAYMNSPYHTRPVSTSSRRSSREYNPFINAQSTTPSSTSEENFDKKSNRASRILRRMSSSLSASRKSLAHAISPTVREESEPPPTGQSPSPHLSQSLTLPTSVVEIGDVNVQFPDTLLWKRRSMRLDTQGFLVLTRAQSSKDMENRAVLKRYHLTEFRLPHIPEHEMQELPNSVVLDFVEGGSLQVACEDRGGQARTLNILQENHRSWAMYTP